MVPQAISRHNCTTHHQFRDHFHCAGFAAASVGPISAGPELASPSLSKPIWGARIGFGRTNNDFEMGSVGFARVLVPRILRDAPLTLRGRHAASRGGAPQHEDEFWTGTEFQNGFGLQNRLPLQNTPSLPSPIKGEGETRCASLPPPQMNDASCWGRSPAPLERPAPLYSLPTLPLVGGGGQKIHPHPRKRMLHVRRAYSGFAQGPASTPIKGEGYIQDGAITYEVRRL